MIFPWPESIKTSYLILFATALTFAEVLIGTSPLFALCMFMYTIFAGLALNAAGGLYTFSGSFIAFQCLQSILISQVAKVLFFQPADSNLHEPVTTAAVYAVGEMSLLGAAIVARKYRRFNPILDSRVDAKFTMAMSITSSFIGIVSTVLVGTIGSDSYGQVEGGSIWSYIQQLGNFLQIGIVLGTAHIILSSGGKRSARWWTIIPITLTIIQGIANNSKQGIYQPFALWVLCCALYRYKFNRLQVMGLIASGIVGVMVVFPVVQYSRAYVREGNLVNRSQLVFNYMRDNSITQIRAAYKADEELKEEDGAQGYYFYYGKDEGVLDRVSLISVEDAVVSYTLANGTGGYDSFNQVFIAMVPRYFMPDKDRRLGASIVNTLGRETGILGAGDETTSIAFSLYGPTFYMGGWWALTVLTFLIMGLTFLLVDSFYGDARVSIYALLPIAANIHGSAEMVLPTAFAGILHICIIGVFTLWLIRKMSIVVQVFIVRYSWYETSPTSLAVPRPPPPSFGQGLPIRVMPVPQTD